MTSERLIVCAHCIVVQQPPQW